MTSGVYTGERVEKICAAPDCERSRRPYGEYCSERCAARQRKRRERRTKLEFEAEDRFERLTRDPDWRWKQDRGQCDCCRISPYLEPDGHIRCWKCGRWVAGVEQPPTRTEREVLACVRQGGPEHKRAALRPEQTTDKWPKGYWRGERGELWYPAELVCRNYKAQALGHLLLRLREYFHAGGIHLR